MLFRRCSKCLFITKWLNVKLPLKEQHQCFTDTEWLICFRGPVLSSLVWPCLCLPSIFPLLHVQVVGVMPVPVLKEGPFVLTLPSFHFFLIPHRLRQCCSNSVPVSLPSALSSPQSHPAQTQRCIALRLIHVTIHWPGSQRN